MKISAGSGRAKHRRSHQLTCGFLSRLSDHSRTLRPEIGVRDTPNVCQAPTRTRATMRAARALDRERLTGVSSVGATGQARIAARPDLLSIDARPSDS